MNGNTLGKVFKITSFGESHGKCVGIVVDGCPAGLRINEDDIQKELDRRKPGQNEVSSGRKEDDNVEILSGTFNNITTGAPITLLIWNKDMDSNEYEKMKFTPRPGHADFTSYIKYGGFNDYRGGGRFSGRITAGFVMAGAIAKKILETLDIEVLSYTVEIGGIKAKKTTIDEIKKNVGKNVVRCADIKAAKEMFSLIKKIKEEGDSLGGVIEGMALNVPPGIGDPVFDTIEGDLAKALFSIPGVKGVEFGSGFQCSKLRGSENNDNFVIKKGRIITETNNSGGILGGISDGMPIVCRVCIKPTPSIPKIQKTVNIKQMKNTNLEIKGRYDTCIVPRAVPVVESMMAIVLVDHAIRSGLISSPISRIL